MKNEKYEPTSDATYSNNGRSGGHSGFKKKVGGKSNIPTNYNDYFRGLSFNIGKDSPNLYKKTIDKLALYSSTQFKNGSGVIVCLRSKEYVDRKYQYCLMNQLPMTNAYGNKNERSSKNGACPKK